ncbi:MULTISPECIES: metal-dependent hydrolase family protein [Brevibacterium]|uniref:Metal-dependent hydrolase n=3 Tax=Bacteria TaxID=2 RepID=K9AF55_9MICO|nr:amidohydrolase family protein [Brevibacterium casei]EKU45934.1 metal-dependent hydrolase [Brevibacterium casei S18]MCT1447026.1 amidohydrolase family protein [Brevibacterium casei]MCT1551544.1 amidohydrolase family protein [Brevibacterium casei]MCT1560987.1 amidohydrolase family protein [Brevibacterium casei]MCT2209303.1 amidohydrolase family protein [Brevibacterium casei]
MVTVFTNAQVFDGTRFIPGRRDVVVDGGRITAITEAGQGSHNASDTFVDCSERTLVPGIIDCHVHLMSAGAASTSAFHDPFSLPFYSSVRHMEETLAGGVTTMRDAGGTDLGAKVAVDTGVVRGPRMTIAVTIMSQTGGHGDFHLVSGSDSPFLAPHPGRPSGVADGVDGVRRKTRELLRAGADHIKICSTGGVLSPRDDPRHSQFTEEEIAVIVAEAAAQGAHVMSHAQGAPGIKNAVRAGVRSIEHGIYLDDEAIDLMLEHGTFLVPTLQAPRAVIKAAEAGASLPQSVIDKAHAVIETHHESIVRAHEAGIRIAMGTDAGVGPHGKNLEEISLLAGAGLSSAEALAAGTSVAADLLGHDDRGRIAPDALADLVLVDGDLSSDDVRGIEDRVSEVWLDGTRV